MKPIYLLLALLFFACQQERSKDRVEQIAHDTLVIAGDTLTEGIIVDTFIEKQLNLIMPDNKFNNSYHELHDYLSEYYELVMDTIVLDSNPLFAGTAGYICEFILYYQNGIDFYVQSCNISSLYVKIRFPHVNKSEVVKVMDKVLAYAKTKDYGNVWLKDSTKFEPSKGGAGCYYTVKEVPDTIIVTYDCGC